MVGFAVLLLIAKIKREQTFKSDANIKINHLDGNYLIDEQTILNTIKRKFPINQKIDTCLLYTSPSPRDRTRSRMPSSA